MKNVTMQFLKQNLSSVLSAAMAGARIVVTRHRRPVAEIGPTGSAHLRVGDQFGTTRLRPAIKPTTGTRYLDVLAEDRSGSDDL